jgi:chemotaxis protein methyltransferase CheR
VISELLLSQLNELITRRMGLRFTNGSSHRLQRGIEAASRDFGFSMPESCVRWLLSADLSRTQIETLASHLTVGETFFFREKQALDAVENHILPQLVRLRRGKDQRLRIWSAGCCTGEEPYSLAILLDKILPDIKEWNITILATDINPGFLRKASGGLYGKWSFRNCPEWVQDGYFQKTTEGNFQIKPEIMKMVRFDYHNLGEDSYPSLSNNTNAMDIIFCRNVLMYFSPETARTVTMKLYRSLVECGVLIINPTESSFIQCPPFTAVKFADSILYSKGNTVGLKEKEIRNKPPYSDEEKIDAPSTSTVLLSPETANDLASIIREESLTEITKQEAPVIKPSSYALALSQYEQGNYTGATEILLELVSDNEEGLKATVLLARAFANQGELKEALKWCDKAVTSDKLVPFLHYLRATILQEQGSSEDAANALKRALYLDQDFVLAHYTIGVNYRNQGKPKEAAKYLGNALKLLGNYQEGEILPESDGTTAGRLGEVIRLLNGEKQ